MRELFSGKALVERSEFMLHAQRFLFDFHLGSSFISSDILWLVGWPSRPTGKDEYETSFTRAPA